MSTNKTQRSETLNEADRIIIGVKNGTIKRNAKNIATGNVLTKLKLNTGAPTTICLKIIARQVIKHG